MSAYFTEWTVCHQPWTQSISSSIPKLSWIGLWTPKCCLLLGVTCQALTLHTCLSCMVDFLDTFLWWDFPWFSPGLFQVCKQNKPLFFVRVSFNRVSFVILVYICHSQLAKWWCEGSHRDVMRLGIIRDMMRMNSIRDMMRLYSIRDMTRLWKY